ncbi:hypothetical protein FGB62_261g013 [Gracilaria domingensis]|nr:hypothetical protein FGB62_261g013 [Gracilaria domingensis]
MPPVAVPIALEDSGESLDYERLLEGPDAPVESDESSEGNQVETILSGVQNDGVFIRKKTGSRASSVEKSRENSSESDGGQSGDEHQEVSEFSAESTGVHDLFREADQREINKGHEKGSSPELSKDVQLVDNNHASEALAALWAIFAAYIWPK